MLKKFTTACLLCFFCLTGVALAQMPLPPDSLALGLKYTDWLLEGKADSLQAHMMPDLQERITTEQIMENSDRIAMQAGFRSEILEQKYVMRNGKPQYWHTAKYSNMDEPLVIRWVIEPDGRIGGVGINPQSQNPPTDAQ